MLPSVRTVNSSSTQPLMLRLRVDTGNFGATYSMRASELAPTMLARCAAFARSAASSVSAALSSLLEYEIVRPSSNQASAAATSPRASAPRISRR